MQDELSKEDLTPGFREWCICEFMGHLRIIGLVTQEDLFGAKLLRVDIPATESGQVAHTEYFGGSAIYRLTPVTEAVAWELLLMGETARPVTPWELARLRDAQMDTKNNLRTPVEMGPDSDEVDFEDEDWPEDDPTDEQVADAIEARRTRELGFDAPGSKNWEADDDNS